MKYWLNFFNYIYKCLSLIQGIFYIYKIYNTNNQILTPEIKVESITESLTTKTSSITFEIFFKNLNDTLAQSLIDYITSRPNIQSILYTNNNFRLNHKLPILIDEDIYICLLKDNNQDSDNMSQIIEMYSYTLNVDELRSYIKKIEYNYNIKIQNKLGDKLFYFNDMSTGKINKNDYNKIPPFISFTMKQFITNRKFKNVIGPESKLIENRVNFFKNNKKD